MIAYTKAEQTRMNKYLLKAIYEQENTIRELEERIERMGRRIESLTTES